MAICSTVLSGFFALASVSLRSFHRAELEKALGGDPRRMESFERHLPALRVMCAFLRSLVNLLLAVATIYLFESLGLGRGWGMALWSILLAGAVMGVVGAAVPNAWAAHGAERVLAGTLGLLIAMRYVLWPVLAALAAFEAPVRRLTGGQEDLDQSADAKQEIVQAASEAQAEGAVRPEEARMVSSILRFGDLRAGDIMTPRTEIFALSADTPCSHAQTLLSVSGHSRVPVYQDGLDNILGILYAKDLLSPVAQAPDATLRALIRKAFFVPVTKPLNELLREFRARKVHLAVVLDEYGGTAGLVSIEDVLEEIVGEIADEYDRGAEPVLRRTGPHAAELEGRVPLDDLNEALGLKIPPGEDYTTAAGLVLAELGYIPSAGETVVAAGAKFTVLAATPRQITRLRVEVLPTGEAEQAPRRS